MVTKEMSEELNKIKADWDIFCMIQRIIVRVGCANLREDTVIQNIIIFLFADIRYKGSLTFCSQVGSHEIGKLG
jgi:hypothetical protein